MYNQTDQRYEIFQNEIDKDNEDIGNRNIFIS